MYKTRRVKSATNTGNYAKFLHKLRLFFASGGLRGLSFPDRPQAAQNPPPARKDDYKYSIAGGVAMSNGRRRPHAGAQRRRVVVRRHSVLLSRFILFNNNVSYTNFAPAYRRYDAPSARGISFIYRAYGSPGGGLCLLSLSVGKTTTNA